ncbi:MAG: HD domain-containing protein [Microthrixaceae bacterium]
MHQATAFRRLAGKTQVFIFPEDHQRTRLTHALEVAQVATAIAWGARINVSLTEAIALGHDCGHGPGGHASEDAFAPYLRGGLRPRRLGSRRCLGAAQSVLRDLRRDPEPQLVSPCPVDSRRRGCLMG